MNRARLGALLGVFAGVLLCLSACSTDYSRSYNRALDTFASGEYAEAAEAFERLGDYAQAPAYAAYSRGLVLYEQGQYAEAEPYFAQSLDILYGQERYQYCHAHVLAEEGRFAEAAEAFEAIGDFEDAPLRSQYCLGRDAEANARRNGVRNIRFLCADAGEQMARWAADARRPDVVLLDPPRAGCSPQFLQALMHMGPKRAVYISCDPETQARDLAVLCDAYRVMSLQPVDLFPHTRHIECIAALEKRV